MATIYSSDGYEITAGLQGCSVCDEALQAAYRIAEEREEEVILEDDDGTWAITPDGDSALISRADLVAMGFADSEFRAGDRIAVSPVLDAYGYPRSSAGLEAEPEFCAVVTDVDGDTVYIEGGPEGITSVAASRCSLAEVAAWQVGPSRRR